MARYTFGTLEQGALRKHTKSPGCRNGPPGLYGMMLRGGSVTGYSFSKRAAQPPPFFMEMRSVEEASTSCSVRL